MKRKQSPRSSPNQGRASLAVTASPRDLTGGMGNAFMQDALGGPLSHSDSLGNLSEEESLKQQLYQERMSKPYSTTATTMKKSSDPESGITGNLK